MRKGAPAAAVLTLPCASFILISMHVSAVQGLRTLLFVLLVWVLRVWVGYFLLWGLVSALEPDTRIVSLRNLPIGV